MLLLQHFTKQCTQCHDIKRFTDFSKDARKKYGIRCYCKQCNLSNNQTPEAKARKKYNRNKPENKKRDSDRQKEYDKKTYVKEARRKTRLLPENKQKRLEYQKEYLKTEKSIDSRRKYRRTDNAIKSQRERQQTLEYKQYMSNYSKTEKAKEYLKKYRQTDSYKERFKKYFKNYMNTPAGKSSAKNSQQKRRSITKGGDLTTSELIVLEQNAKNCYWCGVSLSKIKVHIDHYMPLKLKGEHTISNLVVSCASCNLKKNAKDPLEFANSIGRLL